MARYNKSADGRYHIHGKTHEILIGTRAQVWHGTAYKTSGGLKKSDLMQNKSGRIVSEKKHHTAKRDNRLIKSGYGTKKGHFGWVKVGSRRHSKRHSRSHSKRHRKSMRGGAASMPSSNTSHNSTVSSDTTSTSGNSNQTAMLQKIMEQQNSGSTTTNTNSNSMIKK